MLLILDGCSAWRREPRTAALMQSSSDKYCMNHRPPVKQKYALFMCYIGVLKSNTYYYLEMYYLCSSYLYYIIGWHIFTWYTFIKPWFT